MFKKNLFVLSIICASALTQTQVFAYSEPDVNEYDLAKEVMYNINNKTQLYRDAISEFERARDDDELYEVYQNVFYFNPGEVDINDKSTQYRIVEAKLLKDKDADTNDLHRGSGYSGEGYKYQAAGYSSTGDMTVNGKTLLNEDVEMNHSLVVHNGLDVGDGILSASQSGVAIKLKPAEISSRLAEIPSNVNGMLASNDGYVAVGHSGNQIGFNSEKAEIISASGQSRVTVSHDTATVQASKEIHLSGGNTSVRINDEGVTLNNARIHGVAPGIADTDAVNVSQLRSLRGHVNSVDKDLRAGVAMAMAAASLPQSYIPGKSLASLGAGTYRGQSGFAVGVSSISDNGKWIFKAHGTGDTRGNFGAGIGAGYMF